MQRCKDDIQREFYIKITKKFGWTKDVLINQLEAGAFERYMANQTNFDKAVPEKYRHQAKLAVKDEYSFDFLELGEEHSEKELERSLLENVRKFLIEMGSYFTFVGNQYRLEIEGQEFFIDLLLYHRQLRCLVAIEIKIGAFKPEYAGKMQFYLSALNDRAKLSDENPSIGIILYFSGCQVKNLLLAGWLRGFIWAGIMYRRIPYDVVIMPVFGIFLTFIVLWQIHGFFMTTLLQSQH